MRGHFLGPTNTNGYFLGCPIVIREKWFCVDGNFWTAIGNSIKEAIDNMEYVLGNEWKHNRKYPRKES